MSIYKISNRLERYFTKFQVNRYKRKLNAMDKNVMIFGVPLVIKEPQNITVGENCRFNEHVFLHGGGGITVEDNVTFSAYSKVISWTYDTKDWKNNYIRKDHLGSPIYIGEGAWIGAGAMILPGVKITGKGVIVAAGSIVTKDVNEDFVLVGGTPAKILKRYN